MGSEIRGCDRTKCSSPMPCSSRSLTCDIGFPNICWPATSPGHLQQAYPLQTPILQARRPARTRTLLLPAFIAYLTRRQDSYAVAGTHGKSTTCSVASHLLREASRLAFHSMPSTVHPKLDRSTIPITVERARFSRPASTKTIFFPTICARC